MTYSYSHAVDNYCTAPRELGQEKEMNMTDEQIENAFQKLGISLCAEEIELTADTLDDFVTASANYAECGPIERTATSVVIEGVQVKKGATRGTLRVVDFGEKRGVYFG